MKKFLRSFPFDYLTVIACLIAANVVVGIFAPRNIRQVAFENAIKKTEEHENENLSLLVVGDSRSALLNKNILMNEMGLGQKRNLNLSCNTGSWISSFSLLLKTKKRIDKHTILLVCVSEYWLERPNLQDRAGFLPAFEAYLALGLPEDALSSVLPLSAKRGQIAKRIRDWAEAPFRPITSNDYSKPQIDGMDKSNVDLWFSSIKKDQLDENIAFADQTLGKMKLMTPNIVLVYLPNAKIRESYVSKTYQGRRERFILNITSLARKHRIPFIDMSDEPGLDANGLYADFHHWNETGSKLGTIQLAKMLVHLPKK